VIGDCRTVLASCSSRQAHGLRQCYCRGGPPVEAAAKLLAAESLKERDELQRHVQRRRDTDDPRDQGQGSGHVLDEALPDLRQGLPGSANGQGQIVVVVVGIAAGAGHWHRRHQGEEIEHGRKPGESMSGIMPRLR
jgi:hypothetical protein